MLSGIVQPSLLDLTGNVLQRIQVPSHTNSEKRIENPRVVVRFRCPSRLLVRLDFVAFFPSGRIASRHD